LIKANNGIELSWFNIPGSEQYPATRSSIYAENMIKATVRPDVNKAECSGTNANKQIHAHFSPFKG
jgi:hypothetical protein